jgi:hypothetical protein
VKFEQPGRELWFMPTKRDPANQVSQMWACTLLLAPSGMPISDPPEIEFEWPDRASPIKGTGIGISFDHFELAYVRDEVLSEYKNRDEFDIPPEEGFVAYDDRWAVSFCNRFGRNHIELELRKLYEGAPDDVIKHFNRFAVKAAIAEKDREMFGSRHIGIRARDLIHSFLRLTATLSQLSDEVGVPFTQEEIGQLSSAEIDYRGWWKLVSLKSLGHVVPTTLVLSEFLNRCKEVFELLENLRPISLRQILIRLGIKKEDIAEFAGLKLLATICQLAILSSESGFDLVSDCTQILASWNTAQVVPQFRPLFALNTLRNAEAHKLSESTTKKFSEALETFGIDEAQCRVGWGRALDLIYDETTSSLNAIDELIRIAGI